MFKRKDEWVNISELQPIDMINETSKAVMLYLDIPFAWTSQSDYEEIVDKINKIPCVNDACERAVQLADKVNEEGPKSEDARQDFYLTIQMARQQPASSLAALQQYYKALPPFFLG